jgi:hypothetical protein
VVEPVGLQIAEQVEQAVLAVVETAEIVEIKVLLEPLTVVVVGVVVGHQTQLGQHILLEATADQA